MLKKLSIVISLSLWSGAAAFADNGLVVSYAGGESDEFVLSQIARMAFEDGNLKIISDREAPRLISLATIARMNFSDKVSIETVTPDVNDIAITYDKVSETLTFSGLPEGTTPVRHRRPAQPRRSPAGRQPASRTIYRPRRNHNP